MKQAILVLLMLTASHFYKLYQGRIYNTLSKARFYTHFYRRHVLEISSGISELGTIRWQLVVALFAAWFAVFLCLLKGIKTSGKVGRYWSAGL